MDGSISVIAIVILLLLLFLDQHIAQYAEDSSKFREVFADGVAELREQIESHPDTNLYFFPDRAAPSKDNYTFDYPDPGDYRIGIDVDPCRYNSYNCCMNAFGSTEYPSLITSGLEQERFFKYDVLAAEEEVSTNYVLIYEDGTTVSETASRYADDEAVYDEECVSLEFPYPYCRGRNFALKRSLQRPVCVDNNASLNSLAGCFDTDGQYSEKCVQIGYTSNTFIAQCSEDAGDHCGTFLEVHIAHGTPYGEEADVISEVRIDQRNVSGFYTTTLPTTYRKNDSKVLCSHTESFLRIGSLVYIKPSAPVCCCPTPFLPDTRVGSFQCPIGARGSGAFAYKALSLADTILQDTLHLAYPFCHTNVDTATEDRFMCSVYDVNDRRHYTRNCTKVERTSTRIARSWTSIDLKALYDDPCPYYDNCGLTLDEGLCRLGDLRFTFIGRVGIVTALDNEAVIPQVWVTFNNNRTSYQFNQRDVKLETTPKSMYEIWWVVRSLSGFTVQKRKGFNVTEPLCTYDTTNDRFFPYAILDEQGAPLDSSLVP